MYDELKNLAINILRAKYLLQFTVQIQTAHGDKITMQGTSTYTFDCKLSTNILYILNYPQSMRERVCSVHRCWSFYQVLIFLLFVKGTSKQKNLERGQGNETVPSVQGRELSYNKV